MKKQNRKRLDLAKETIRLQTIDLVKVVGGLGSSASGYVNPKTCAGCETVSNLSLDC